MQMLRSLLAISLLCLPDQINALESADVYSTWKLVSSKTRIIETGEGRNSLGPKPIGYITYTPDGRMITLAVSNERPNVGNTSKLTDEDRAKLFRTMWGYAGTFTLQGNSITHHVDTSWNEVWSGMDFVRDIEARDDKLVFTTKPQMSMTTGKMEVLTLVWEKVK